MKIKEYIEKLLSSLMIISEFPNEYLEETSTKDLLLHLLNDKDKITPGAGNSIVAELLRRLIEKVDP